MKHHSQVIYGKSVPGYNPTQDRLAGTWAGAKTSTVVGRFQPTMLFSRGSYMDGYVEKLLEFAHLCMIALLAACAKVSHQTLHGAPFKFTMFVALLMVAIFAAYLAGTIIPPTMEYRDSIVGIAAWSGSEFVRAIELRVMTKIRGEANPDEPTS